MTGLASTETKSVAASARQPAGENDAVPVKKKGGNNAIVYLSGRLLALVCTFGVQLVLVRALEPIDYALYAVVLAISGLLQTAGALGIPRIIPRFVSRLGISLSPRGVRHLLLGVIGFRVFSVLLVAVAMVVAARMGAFDFPGIVVLIPVSAAYILASVLQIDADGTAQALMRQRLARFCLVSEAALRLTLLGLLYYAQGGVTAGQALGISTLTYSLASLALFGAIWLRLHHESDRTDDGEPLPGLNATELRHVAMGGYVSSLGTVATAPPTIRLLGSFWLSVTSLAGFSFLQSLMVSLRRYTPGALMFPFIEPFVMRRYAKTGDPASLTAALSVTNKVDVLVMGPIVVATTVAGRQIVELLSGGRYGDIAYALPLLLVYTIAGSMYRTFEALAVTFTLARALWWIFVVSVGSLLLTGVLTFQYGLIALLVVPVVASTVRLLMLYLPFRRLGLEQAVDIGVQAAIIFMICLFSFAGWLLTDLVAMGPITTIATGSGFAIACFGAILLLRPLRRSETDLLVRAEHGAHVRLLRSLSRADPHG